MGEVLLAGEEPHKRPALSRGHVADRPTQHWIRSFKCVEHRALGHRTLHLELHDSFGLGQGPQMGREHDPDHCSVCTSTERTDGRSRTIGVHGSPELAGAYTWPPVVPTKMPHEPSESTSNASRSTLT